MAEHQNYINFERKNRDFNVIQYGYRKCEPGFGEKPHIWSTFLLHYVYSGKGYLNADGRKIHVSEGEAFVIFPGQIANYFADEAEPFEYRWIEFYGDGMRELLPNAAFSVKNPVVEDDSGEIGRALKDIVDSGELPNAALMSKFWTLVGALSVGGGKEVNSAERYVQQAVYYIQENIGKKTTVIDVSSRLNLSKTYFTSIFTKQMGIPPKKYILSQHMETAKELLKRTSYSVGEIANIVGYDDSSDFTKAFIRYEGTAPSAYRKSAGKSEA
ncbi:MAG: AraC family transcriptional regulator [Clostridia bacterium]